LPVVWQKLSSISANAKGLTGEFDIWFSGLNKNERRPAAEAAVQAPKCF